MDRPGWSVTATHHLAGYRLAGHGGASLGSRPAEAIAGLDVAVSIREVAYIQTLLRCQAQYPDLCPGGGVAELLYAAWPVSSKG